jgi:hypothetical protein
MYCSRAGLPDGKFSYQKYQFGEILDGLAMVDVGTYILWPFGPFSRHFWPFGICCSHSVYFSSFGML